MSLAQPPSAERSNTTPPAVRSSLGSASPRRPAFAEFAVRPWRPEDEEKTLDLLALCLPRWVNCGDRAALWRWKHMESPFGRSHVLVAAASDGKILGALALMPWQLEHQGHVVPCARTVDMVTHPDYQGMGIASSFWTASKEHLVAAKTALTFHTPNRRSVSFSRKGGRPVWRLQPRFASRDPLRLLPAMLRYFGSRGSVPEAPQRLFRGNPLTMQQLLSRGEAVEQLLAADARRGADQLRTRRSLAYLQWRYAGHPALRYYAVCTESEGRITGCVIFRADSWKGIVRLVVQDVLLEENRRDLISDLRRELATEVDADLVQHFDAGGGVSKYLLRGTGLPTPKRINFTVGIYHPDLSPLALEPARWGLTLGDLQEI